MKALLLALVVALGCTAGCVGGPAGLVSEDLTEIAFERLDVEKSAAPEGLTVLKSKSAFSSFFGQPPPPSVDFQRHWVVHLSAGMKSTGGYGIDVVRIVRTGSGSNRKLLVYGRATSPGPDCVVTQATTNPQLTVRINKQPNTPQRGLELESEIVSCGGDVCASQHAATTDDGHEIVVCEEVYSAAPYVRPEEDTDATAYIATDGRKLYQRGKDARDLTNSEREELEVESHGRRYAFTIYRATLDESGDITAAVPAIVIQDAAFLRFLAGRHAEGFMSRHKTDPNFPNFQYEREPSLKMRIAFGDPRPNESAPSDEVLGWSELPIQVENLDKAVIFSDGACAPPMTDAGAENPFDGQSSVELKGTRVPSMHAPGDNEFVLGGTAPVNHMSPAWIILPHHLLLAKEKIELEPAHFTGHGNPLVMPVIELTLVEDGGGATCTP
jgi:hypothetical protein